MEFKVKGYIYKLLICHKWPMCHRFAIIDYSPVLGGEILFYPTCSLDQNSLLFLLFIVILIFCRSLMSWVDYTCFCYGLNFDSFIQVNQIFQNIGQNIVSDENLYFNINGFLHVHFFNIKDEIRLFFHNYIKLLINFLSLRVSRWQKFLSDLCVNGNFLLGSGCGLALNRICKHSCNSSQAFYVYELGFNILFYSYLNCTVALNS